MRFLADENIPRPVVLRLREAGYDVTFMAEIGAGTLDPDVLRQTGERLLLTSDRDFGTLLYAKLEDPPTGVVYFRPGAERAAAVSERLLNLLREPRRVLAGQFTVVERHRTRQRPLPPA